MPTFDEWLLDRGQAMLAFAWLVTRNRRAAHAVLQEALSDADHHWDRFRSLGDAESHVRRAVVKGADTAVSTRGEAAAPAPSWGPMDDVERAWLASADLSSRQRAVVALRFAEGSSVGDIARVLDVSDGAVRDDLDQALAHVRTATQEQR